MCGVTRTTQRPHRPQGGQARRGFPARVARGTPRPVEPRTSASVLALADLDSVSLGLGAIVPPLAGFALALLLLHEGLVALDRRPEGVGDTRQ